MIFLSVRTRVFAALILLCSAIPTVAAAPAANPDVAPPLAQRSHTEHTTTDRLVLAYHYPWYGYKEPKQWDKQPSIIDHPLLGPYRSDDPNLIDFQVSLAGDAGIDAFIVSWSGPDTTPGKIFEQMLDHVGKHYHHRFHLCVVVEHLANDPDLSSEKLRLALAHVLSEYATRPAYLKVSGKPVVFIYQAHTLPLDRWQVTLEDLTRHYGPAFYVAVPDGWDIDLEYLSVFDGIVPYADKYYTDDVLTKAYKQVAQCVAACEKPLIVAAIGGGSRIRKLGFDIDRSQGRYLRRRFALAQQIGASWVTITSWNEWYEAMQIEPSREYGYEQIQHVRQLTAAFKDTTPRSLNGTRLLAKQKPCGVATKLLVKNTGSCNVYCVTAVDVAGRHHIMAYVLHPGDDASMLLEANCQEVTAHLPDDTKLSAHP